MTIRNQLLSLALIGSFFAFSTSSSTAQAAGRGGLFGRSISTPNSTYSRGSNYRTPQSQVYSQPKSYSGYRIRSAPYGIAYRDSSGRYAPGSGPSFGPGIPGFGMNARSAGR